MIHSRFFPVKGLFPNELTLKKFYAVLTEAHLVSDDDKPVNNFDELFTKCNLDKSENNLFHVRKKGLIYEGDKIFSFHLGQLLYNNASSGNVNIRSSETGKVWKYGLDDFFNEQEFFSLVDEYCGEFHFTDDSNNWYGVLRDDDPIIFFAVNDYLSSRLVTHFQENILQLSPDFNCY